MYIYNVTVNVSADVHDEWLKWMRDVHIPDVMKTGCFMSNRLVKVLNVEDEGHTYSFQYTFKDMKDIERYQGEFAPALQADVKKRYADKFHAFRTLLEIIE
ncbi:MAG: DUF4286 family protein [Bacteroidia bacterium]